MQPLELFRRFSVLIFSFLFDFLHFCPETSQDSSNTDYRFHFLGYLLSLSNISSGSTMRYPFYASVN